MPIFRQRIEKNDSVSDSVCDTTIQHRVFGILNCFLYNHRLTFKGIVQIVSQVLSCCCRLTLCWFWWNRSETLQWRYSMRILSVSLQI